MVQVFGSGSNKKFVYVAGFVLHFLLILLISVRQGLSDLARGNTLFPHSLDPWVRRADLIASAALGENLRSSNPLRQGITAYTHMAGIDTGYGFFAPSVSFSHKLVFEISFPDGRVEYELPRVGGAATGVRLPLLFDSIARTHYELLRETMLKMMAFSVWQHHPDADKIRTVFGFVRLPSISDFENGKEESYEFLYAYDFRFSEPPGIPKP